MKKIKRIVSFILVIAMILTTAFYGEFNTKAATNADGTTDTEVNIKTDTGWSTRSVLFMLSESDYTTDLKNGAMGSKIDEYNFLEKITVTYNGTTYTLENFAEAGSWTYVPARDANVGSFGFKVPESYGAVPTGIEIAIPAGTVFPSYAYVGTASVAGTSTAVGGYITTAEYKYVFKNTNGDAEYIWEKSTTQTNTDVNVKTDTGWSDRSVLFMLSESDYTSELKNVAMGSKISEYNFLEKITVTYNGTTYTLENFAEAGSWTYVPARSANAGSFGFKVPASYGAVPAGLEIAIPAGTVFPSYDYVGTSSADGTASVVGGYVTTQEYKYVFNNTTSAGEYIWEKSSTQTKTEASIKTDSGWSGRSVLFMLSESDYTSSIKGYAVNETKITEYNFLETITVTINGTAYALKDVVEAGTWTYVPVRSANAGSIGVKISSTYGGVSTGMVITIPTGTVFPSYSYVGTTTADGTSTVLGGYVTTEECSYVYRNTNSDTEYMWATYTESAEVEPTEISVTKLQSGVNASLNGITFTLSDSDFENCTNYQMGDSYTDYNFLSDVKVYVEDTEYSLDDLDKDSGAKYYNLFGNANTVTIEFADADIYNSITKIVIPESVVFPALAHTGATYFAGTDDSHPAIDSTQESAGGFITTESITFYRPLDATGTFTWQTTEPIEPTEISINSFRTGHNGNIVSFTLSDSDYYSGGSALGTTSIGSLHTDYNYLDMILVYTSDSEYVTLKEAYKSTATHYYNMWGVSNTVSVELNADVFSSAVRIVIPSGTVFPSYAYTSGATTEKGGYITTADVTLVKPEATNSTYNGIACYAWETYVEVEEQTTKVTDVQLRDSRLLFFLTEQDYSCEKNTSITATNLAKYNTLENIIVLLNGEEKTLSEIYGSQAFYNLYGETGSVAFQAGATTSTYTTENITQVLVKAGCEFPSYTFTNNGGTVMTTYVVEEDIVFSTDSSDTSGTHWTKTEARTIETTVDKIVLQNNAITFALSDSDYPSGSELPNMVATDKHKEYNYWNQIRVYTEDTTYKVLSDAYSNEEVYYTMWTQDNTLSVRVDSNTFSNAVRIVIPENSVFPAYDYTGGTESSTTYPATQMEMSGYEIKYEMIFEKDAEGNWVDVSYKPSEVSADADGTEVVDSRDIVRAKWYIKNGYGHNLTSDCDDDYDTDEDDVQLIREVLLGRVLHNYKKESNSLTYFGGSNLSLNYFLNDYFKRHIGYNDYVEGDMTATSYKIGTYVDGIFNLGWNTTALTWFDSFSTLETNRLAGQKEIIENVIVDKYGYAWDGNDEVEDTELNLLTDNAKRSMSWPFPNAKHTDSNARFWEFHEDTNEQDTELSVWSSNFNATIANGVYGGTASAASYVQFEVHDYALIASSREPIINTEYAPWLAVDLRMNTVDYDNIDDIYVSFNTSYNGAYTTVKVSDLAAVNYEFTENYEHMLWLPMYTNSTWIGSNGNGADIYSLKIEIRAKDGTTLSGDFALNYVRPSFDTRSPNTNGIFISSMKQYFDYTGDLEFLKDNITKARRAMNFYLQMYDEERSLISQSYLYGHSGDRDSLVKGVDSGYWDVLYTPEYDFESNMYFYQALIDLAEMEQLLSDKGIVVSDSTSVLNAGTALGLTSKAYSKTISELKDTAASVLNAMRADVSDNGFYNNETGRFAAGIDSKGNVVDNGYTTWNLQAVELGIADTTQSASILAWINGDRAVNGDSSSGLYDYEFAPRSATVENKNSIYGYLALDKLSNVTSLGYGNEVQFGGAVMYTSYYDLMSRMDVLGADNAYGRLKAIQTWYDKVDVAYKNSSETAKNFYLSYYNSQNITMQNGSRGNGNGAVGIDGEFTESILTVAAIPYGFFGIDSEGGDTLCVSPELPTELDRWKIENLAFCGVKYDVSIYADAVRIDSVRGAASGLTIKIALDYVDGQKVYVDGVESTSYVVENGKAIVTVPFADTIVEVR